MKRRKTVTSVPGPSGTRKAGPSLKVNKVRHVFLRNKPARSAAASEAQPGAVRLGKAGRPRKVPKARAIRPLKREVTAAGSSKSSEKVFAALEPDTLSKEKKVYRALRKLHIDFKESKAGPSALARTFSNVTVTRNIKRRSESGGPAPGPSHAEEESSKSAAASDPLAPAPAAPGKRRNSDAGLPESLSSGEAAHTSQQGEGRTDTVTKRMPKYGGSGRLSKSVPAEDVTPDASDTRLKKSGAKPKPGAQTKPSSSGVEGVPESLSGMKKAHKLPVPSADMSKLNTYSILPKTSKRFSTSIYSSRRKSSTGTGTSQTDSFPEPMEVEEGFAVTKDSKSYGDDTLASSADSFQAEEKSELMYQDVTIHRRERGSWSSRHRARGFQRGRGVAGGSFRGMSVTNSIGRGRGLAVSALSKGGSAKLICQGRGRKRSKWTHQKVSVTEVGSGHETDYTEKLSEAEEDGGTESPNEPAAKRGRFKKRPSADAEEEQDQRTPAAGERTDTTRADPGQARTQSSMQPPLARVDRLSRKKSSGADAEETALRAAQLSQKTLKHKPALRKAGSRPVECVVRDGSALGQTRSAAHSRSSSPGGTELRFKSKDRSKAGELSRSSSLDNLLYKSKSSPALKHTRSRAFLRRGSNLVSGSGDSKSPDETVKMESASDPVSSPATPLDSKDPQGSLKRKHLISASAESQKAKKRQLLLTRLQDSSTHQMPDILSTCRTPKLTAFGVSPAMSRESSPAGASQPEGKGSLKTPLDSEHGQLKSEAGSKMEDTNVESSKMTESSLHLRETTDKSDSPSWNVTDQASTVVKGRGKGRPRQLGKRTIGDGEGVSLVKDEASDVTDELNKDAGNKFLPKDFKQGPPSSTIDMSIQSLSHGVEGIRRGRGRPKGSSNRRFRLNLVKHHSSLVRENLEKTQKLQTQLPPSFSGTDKQGVCLPQKRGRGRPRKTPRQPASPPKASQSRQDSQDSKTLIALEPKKRLGRPRKDLSSPANLTSTEVSGGGFQGGVRDGAWSDLSSKEESSVCDSSHDIRRTSDSVDVGSDVAMSSKGQNQSSNDAGSTDICLPLDSAGGAGSSTAKERVLHKAGKFGQSYKLSQRKDRDKKKTLGTLVRMRRESRRQLKKSRWATGRLPKQSRAALSSSVRLKKRPSELSNLSSDEESREHDEKALVPSSECAGQSDSGDSDMDTSVADESLGEAAVIPGAEPSVISHEPTSDDVSSMAAAFNESSDHVLEEASLSEPLLTELSQQPDTTRESSEDQSEHAAVDHPVPSADELSQTQHETATESPVDVEPQHVGESLPTTEPNCQAQTQDKTDPAEPLGDDSPQSADLVPPSADLSASDKIEKGDTVTHEQSEELPLQDKPEQPSRLDQQKEKPIHDQSEQRSMHGETEELSEHDPTQPSMQNQSEVVTGSCSGNDESASDQSHGEPDSSAESRAELSQAGDTVNSSEGSVAVKLQHEPNTSVACDPTPASPVSPDACIERFEKDVTQGSAESNANTQTGAGSQPEVTCQVPVSSELLACQQSEVRPGTDAHSTGCAQSQDVSWTLTTKLSTADSMETSKQDLSSEHEAQSQGVSGTSTTELSSASSMETCASKQDLSSVDLEHGVESQGVKGTSATELLTANSMETCASEQDPVSADLEDVKESSLSESSLLCISQVQTGELSDTVDQPNVVKKAESDSVQDCPDSPDSPNNTDLHEESFSTELSNTEELDRQGPSSAEPSTTDEKGQRKYPVLPIAKRKQKAISRELKRLQTDEGAQRIMSWHEKKKLKTLGKLLRSKIKDSKGEEREEAMEPKVKQRSSKLYSIDTISDTRLVFKSGKLATPAAAAEHAKKGELLHDQENFKRAKRGILSVSSSMDSEDGAPPDITETPPYKDIRLERGRSEELSPPPLIRPEDLFSEEYYEVLPVAAVKQNQDGKKTVLEAASMGVDSSLIVPQGMPVIESMSKQVGMTNIDTSLGNEASGILSLCTEMKLGPRKKRGRGKRKHGKMGPASKTGREPHIRPGPVSSKVGRKNSSSPKQDPPFIRNMPHLPSEPRTFALRPKTTRSPIEIIAMRQKLEEEAYELEEATRVARKLKRKQALFGKHAIASDSSNQSSTGSCKPCSVVLVDFVKELHLNSVDTSDQYISDVSYDSDEADVDEEDDDYVDEIYGCRPDDRSLVLGVPNSPITGYRKVLETTVLDSLKEGQMSSPRSLGQVSPENMQRTPVRQQTPGSSSSSPDTKKSVPDLDSLRGKGFMGNFVDFIQNRSSQSLVPSPKQRPRFRPKASLSPGRSVPVATSATVVSTLSFSCTSDSVAAAPSLTTMSTLSSSSVVTVSSHGQVVTSAQIHPHRQCQVVKVDPRPDSKIVGCGPFHAGETSKLMPVEKIPYSPQHHAVVKSSPEKSSSPGKLKVFPTRKETDGAAQDKTAFTRYLCTKCEFSATKKGTIESHIYRHIPGVTFTCGYCESEFTGLISALTHVKNSHNSKEPKVWISKDINEASLYTEEEVRSCLEPVVTSPHSSQQEAGSADSADTTAQVGDQPLVQDGQPVFISLVVSGDRPVPRTEHFTSSPLATQRRFACTHCSYCTNVMEDAHQHVRDLHSESSLFTCYLCDKAFGWSYQDIVAHCKATHPDRPKSYKKLPDFYDQELVRMNTGTSERSKPSEDRGNIFDRMTNFFPNLGPGSELMEDGQLSPQARFLRARDYLYIQEGWSKKTSAEADSTTIEDIEIPFEDVESSGLDSTSEEHMAQRHHLDTDGALASSTGRFDTAVYSKNGSDAETSQLSQTASSDLPGTSSDSKHAPGVQLSRQSAASPSSQTSADKDNIGSRSADGEHNQTPASEEVLENTGKVSPPPVASAEQDARTVWDGSSCVTDGGLTVASGSRDKADGDGGDEKHSLPHGPALSGAEDRCVTGGPGSSGHPSTGQTTKEARLSSSSGGKEGHGSSPAQERQKPAANEGDPECDEDGENDILVIDLGEDVMEDMADDMSHCSSPREERAESSFPADGLTPEKETALRVSEGQDMLEMGERSLASSAALDHSASGDAGDVAAAAGEEAAGDHPADDSMGIKILSVVSLRDRPSQAADLMVSPVKSPGGSELHLAASPSSGSKAPPARKSPATPKSSPSTPARRKSQAASKHLSEVDADDMAARNERMVCTYKCHSCSIHSPALAAIVEHLKQHHHNVPLFSCPYCKAKKESFFTEESVHTHVSEHHPSNYAKNEVSLSEIAKSFVQVLALPSGNRVRGSLIEEDIYMCLQCESHVPDLDYALRHLKYEHPGLLKYACPICGTFSDSLQDVVKKHMLEVHGQASDSVQLAMAMEGVYLSKVNCISVSGQYIDHSPDTPPRSAASSVPVASLAGPVTTIMAASALGQTRFPVAVDSTALVSPGPLSVGPLGVAPVPMTRVSPMALTAGASGPAVPFASPRSGKQRAQIPSSISSLQASSDCPLQPLSFVPLPGSFAESVHPRKRIDFGIPQFQVTGMTVKDILDTRQKNAEILSTGMTVKNILGSRQKNIEIQPSPAVPVTSDNSTVTTLSLSVSTSSREQLQADALTPRGMSSVTNRSGQSFHSPTPTESPSTSSFSKPVLRVPSVSSVLDLTSPSRCSSANTGTSTAGLSVDAVASLSSANRSRHASPLPFSVAALTAPVLTVSSSQAAPASLSLPASPMDREDPEAFKIFNLKPRTPVPQSSHSSGSPVVSAHKSSPSLLSSPSPRMALPSTLTPGPATVASSALFPQQFRLQQFPPVQPASIAALPLAQGGLPLAQNFAVPIGSLNQGLTIPVNMNQPQLLMAQNAFPPVLVPANLLPQLGMRAPAPQLPVLSGTAPPPAHQPVSDVQAAPVNLSLSQLAHSAALPLSPKAKVTKAPPSTLLFQPRVGPSRGRGRPRLLHKGTELQPKPRIPLSSTPRPSAPPLSPAAQPGSDRPGSCPITTSARQLEPSPSPKPLRHSTSHQCVCPYCVEKVILKPWEVAQHIKMSHPGKEVKYNRV